MRAYCGGATCTSVVTRRWASSCLHTARRKDGVGSGSGPSSSGTTTTVTTPGASSWSSRPEGGSGSVPQVTGAPGGGGQTKMDGGAPVGSDGEMHGLHC